MKVKLHVDTRAYSSKPSSKEIGGIIKRLQTSKPVEITLEDLMSQISNGHSISPAVMAGTRAADWQEQQLFLVDIDNEQEGLPVVTVRETLALCDEINIRPAFYYRSFSHSQEKPKFRLVFVMDEPITEPNQRQAISKALVSIFPQSDKACINANRIFYGTNKLAKMHDLEARVTIADIYAMYTSPNARTDIKTDAKRESRLRGIVRDFDFLSFLEKRNGKYRVTTTGATFKNCEVCSHHDNLAYYRETNTFYCFSDKGEVGGSIIDYLIAVHKISTKEAIKMLKHELNGQVLDEEWQAPIPFKKVNLPEFPVQCLPTPLRDYAKANAENLEIAVDMSACAVLAVVASIVQGKFAIKGKQDYEEPLNIYVLIIAKSGERKSPLMRRVTKIIYDYERKVNEQRQAEKRDKLKELSARITKAKDSNNKDEAAKLQTEYNSVENSFKKLLRLIADDVTPEALTSLLADYNGIMSIISTEGGIFDIFAGRYSSKNTVAIDTVLKAYSGDPIRVDRQVRSTERIDHPVLTMLITGQEQILEGLLSNMNFASRGLTARFLYCRPSSKIGRRSLDTPEVSQSIKIDYENLLLDLLKIPSDSSKPKVINISVDAYKHFKGFHDWLEPRLADELEDMDGWCEKLVGAVLRIAGILHCAKHKDNSAGIEVTAKTMKNAIKIGKYFLEHAKYTFSLMGADKTEMRAKFILKRLKNQSERELKKDEIRRLCRQKRYFLKPEDFSQALDLLVEKGYLRHNPNHAPTGGRPNDGTYLLNPYTF
jgi:hypothetical protein